jgi:6-hydroxycyclohex-1-ene-1-carbonyl-CoA dehydrogenase
VVADAVATAYQSVVRSELRPGSLAIVVGAGGVGTYAAQSAKIFGAHVVAIDVDPIRLEALGGFADLSLNASESNTPQLRHAVARFEEEHGLPPHGRRVLECSGSPSGQETAFALLNHDARLAVIGFTRAKVCLRLSNLMAFDAMAFGNWGCLPEHFPKILEHVRAGRIVLSPYVERFPMSRLNELLAGNGHVRRPVLIPDFEETSC